MLHCSSWSPSACWHRLVAVAMVAVVAMASMGAMPSPATLGRLLGRLCGASIGSIAAYPCEDCGCGCAGAMECWTACCCHTPHQRLVWALERGVLPPIGVRFSDAEWIAAANAIRPGSATCGACVVRLKASLAAGVSLVRSDAAPVDRTAASCCSSGKADRACSPGSRTRGPRSLPCASALTCKGGAALVAFAVVLAIPSGAELRIEVVPEGLPPRITATPEPGSRLNRSLDIPAPPPKRCA